MNHFSQDQGFALFWLLNKASLQAILAVAVQQTLLSACKTTIYSNRYPYRLLLFGINIAYFINWRYEFPQTGNTFGLFNLGS